jgi:hypothetical protein
MEKRQIVGALAIVAIVVSVGFTVSSLRGPRTSVTSYQALGWGAAQETAKFLQNQGEIALICPDFGDFKVLNPRYNALLKSFKKAIAKDTKLRISTVERAPVKPPTMARVGVYLSAAQYEDLSNKYGKAGAIVSFAALPNLTDDNLRAAQASGAKWVVVSDYGADYKQLLTRQAMHMAIVPRLTDPPELPKARTLQEQFEREYELITPSRASELPD